MQRFETAILALKEKASDCREEAKLVEMKDDIMKMVVEWRQHKSTKDFEQALKTAKAILDNIEKAGKKQAVAAASASAPVAPFHSIVMEMGEEVGRSHVSCSVFEAKAGLKAATSRATGLAFDSVIKGMACLKKYWEHLDAHFKNGNSSGIDFIIAPPMQRHT